MDYATLNRISRNMQKSMPTHTGAVTCAFCEHVTPQVHFWRGRKVVCQVCTDCMRGVYDTSASGMVMPLVNALGATPLDNVPVGCYNLMDRLLKEWEKD